MSPSQRVLVVEDDEDLRESIAIALELEAIPVATARDGRQALELLYASPSAYGLVFLDLVMPGMNGREFLSVLLKDPRISGIPVYVLSGSDANAARRPIAGAAGYITKPFDVEELVQTARAHLREP